MAMSWGSSNSISFCGVPATAVYWASVVVNRGSARRALERVIESDDYMLLVTACWNVFLNNLSAEGS